MRMRMMNHTLWQTAYLVSVKIGNSQLPLIIQHFFKVRHMPYPVRGVSVKPLKHGNTKITLKSLVILVE
jgi:hypothetical protein